MNQPIASSGPMEASEEVKLRHRFFMVTGAISMMIGAWLMAAEGLVFLGLLVTAPGAMTYGMSRRLSKLSARYDLLLVGLIAVTIFVGLQQREVNRWERALPGGMPKCKGNVVPAGGCYTVSGTITQK